MSHWSILKIRIKNPNKNMLKEAVKMAAKEVGCSILYEGTSHVTLSKGWGTIKVLLESAEIKYDEYNVPKDVVDTFQQLLVQNYSVLALSVGLRNLGYQVSANKVGDKVVIRAVG